MNWHKNYKLKRRVLIGIAILILAVVYFLEDFWFVLRGLSAITFLGVFYLMDHLFNIKFKQTHYLIALGIAIFSFLLAPLYYLYANYDKILHLVQPILASSLIFYTMRSLKIATKWKILFTFFIVTGLVGLHEIGEYGLDQSFDLKLQGVYLRDLTGVEKYDLYQDKIDDTMIDMVFGALGAGIYAGYASIVYLKNKRKKKNIP